jgi:FAD/FMN-containing dehydrogenase
VRASEEDNPELFWALHGGGGNFGVATTFTFRLHTLPSMTVAILLWDPASGEEAIRQYRDFLDSAPEEVGGAAIYLTGPPEEFVPAHLVGRLALMAVVTYAGTEAAAREVIRPMLDLQADAELVMEIPYANLQCLIDDPPGRRNYWSAEYVEELPDAAVARFCALAEQMIVPSPSQHAIIPQGGAMARSTSGYPIPWRDSAWAVHPFAVWDDVVDDDRATTWVRAG